MHPFNNSSKYNFHPNDDEQLVDNLMCIQRQSFVEQKNRQRLRETNHELRDLERQLRCAYIKKGLLVQKKERELIRAYEESLKAKEDELYQQSRDSFKQQEEFKEQEERKKKEKFRLDLQLQMDEINMQERNRKYQEFLKEKKIIDEIARKIYQEKLHEIHEKIQNKNIIQNNIKDFLEQRELIRRYQEYENDEENKKIEAIIKEREQKTNESELKKHLELQKRIEISEELGRKVSAIEVEKTRRADVLEGLLIQEKNALNEIKYREKIESELRERIRMRMETDKVRFEIARRNLEEKLEEDRKYREELAQQLAEQDKLDKLSDERRRRKKIEHRRAIEENLAERKQRRAEELKSMLEQREKDLKIDKQSQEIIEEERIRILKEHATELLGYLPAGLLKDSDHQHFPLPPKQTGEMLNYKKLLENN